MGPLAGGEEELALGVLAELVDQDAEAARGVAAAAGGFGRAEALEEIGAEGFVLAVGGVLWLEEEAGEVSY